VQEGSGGKPGESLRIMAGVMTQNDARRSSGWVDGEEIRGKTLGGLDDGEVIHAGESCAVSQGKKQTHEGQDRMDEYPVHERNAAMRQSASIESLTPWQRGGLMKGEEAKREKVDETQNRQNESFSETGGRGHTCSTMQ
jgi:hypothetical protein